MYNRKGQRQLSLRHTRATASLVQLRVHSERRMRGCQHGYQENNILHNTQKLFTVNKQHQKGERTGSAETAARAQSDGAKPPAPQRTRAAPHSLPTLARPTPSAAWFIIFLVFFFFFFFFFSFHWLFSSPTFRETLFHKFPS